MELMRIYQTQSAPPPTSPLPRILYEGRPDQFSSEDIDFHRTPPWLIYTIFFGFLVAATGIIYSVANLLS